MLVELSHVEFVSRVGLTHPLVYIQHILIGSDHTLTHGLDGVKSSILGDWVQLTSTCLLA